VQACKGVSRDGDCFLRITAIQDTFSEVFEVSEVSSSSEDPPDQSLGLTNISVASKRLKVPRVLSYHYETAIAFHQEAR